MEKENEFARVGDHGCAPEPGTTAQSATSSVPSRVEARYWTNTVDYCADELTLIAADAFAGRRAKIVATLRNAAYRLRNYEGAGATEKEIPNLTKWRHDLRGRLEQAAIANHDHLGFTTSDVLEIRDVLDKFDREAEGR